VGRRHDHASRRDHSPVRTVVLSPFSREKRKDTPRFGRSIEHDERRRSRARKALEESWNTVSEVERVAVATITPITEQSRLAPCHSLCDTVSTFCIPSSCDRLMIIRQRPWSIHVMLGRKKKKRILADSDVNGSGFSYRLFSDRDPSTERIFQGMEGREQKSTLRQSYYVNHRQDILYVLCHYVLFSLFPLVNPIPDTLRKSFFIVRVDIPDWSHAYALVVTR